jgi:formylglycine-generating enzyme required for sulfatase activity
VPKVGFAPAETLTAADLNANFADLDARVASHEGNGDCPTGYTKDGTLRNTGLGTTCVSDWGAEDMIGNVHEFTAGWYIAPTPINGSPIGNYPWSIDDESYGVSSSAFLNGTQVNGSPAIMARGGHRTSGALAGILSVNVAESPRSFNALLGFRCVRPH